MRQASNKAMQKSGSNQRLKLWPFLRKENPTGGNVYNQGEKGSKTAPTPKARVL
jgi:hypothetical protein